MLGRRGLTYIDRRVSRRAQLRILDATHARFGRFRRCFRRGDVRRVLGSVPAWPGDPESLIAFVVVSRVGPMRTACVITLMVPARKLLRLKGQDKERKSKEPTQQLFRAKFLKLPAQEHYRTGGTTRYTQDCGEAIRSTRTPVKTACSYRYDFQTDNLLDITDANLENCGPALNASVASWETPHGKRQT